MRSALSIATAVCVLLAACGDGSTDPDDGAGQFFVRYQANGAQIEYRDPLLIHAVFTTVGSQNVFAVEGVSPDGTITGSSVNVSVMDVSPITVRSYVGFQIGAAGITSASILYRTGGFEYSNTTNSDNRVTVTEITPQYVRGTFSGTTRATGRPNVAITNGEFYVQRVN
jgi:hypothetical protein